MAKYAKLIDEKDNVVTIVADCGAGDEVTVKSRDATSTYKCNERIAFGHKMAIKQMKAGAKVIKYGSPIGSASRDIRQGDWVHIHNVKDDYKCLDKTGKPLPGQE